MFITPNETKGKNDSESIQNAVDLASSKGINKVIIPRFNERLGECKWIIERTVRLPSDMEIVLDNCFMVMADDVVGGFFSSDNLFTERGTKREFRMKNITIRGEGHAVLDGGKPTALSEKTQNSLGVPVRLNTPIFFLNVEGFSVRNISITNQRYWGMRFEFCSRGIIRDIFFSVKRDRFNQDGINLRNGCHDILIENIFGQTGDDMIALSAIDTDTKLGFGEKYPVIVEGVPWDIHDITIRNISGAAIRHPLIAMRNHNGARLYNINIENVRDTEQICVAENDNFERYAIIALGGNSYAGIRHAVVGETHDISIKDVYASYSVRVLTTQSVVKNLYMSNIHANGVCRSLISTGPDGWANSKSGVKLDGVIIKNVFFNPTDTSRAKILDFGGMREGDFVRGLSLSDAMVENTETLLVLDDACESFEYTTENVKVLDGKELKVARKKHYDITPTEVYPSVWLVDGVETKECDM